MKSRFDGSRCEHCKRELKFQQPVGVTVSTGEQVDVFHSLPWCEAWRNPLSRERCIPRAILDECERPRAS